jgi:hypothetical protein
MVIAMNAIMITGFVKGGWPAGTVLALYWAQTLIAIPLATMLVVFHRRATHKVGYYRTMDLASAGSFLSQFAVAATVFAAGHGLFLAAILFMGLQNSPGAFEASSFRTGLKWLAAIQVAIFLVDLPGLGARPFAWINHRTDILMRRTVSTHLIIIIGCFAAAATHQPHAIYGVFIAFKLLGDIGGEFPEYDPPDPPLWARLSSRDASSAEIARDWREAREERLAAVIQAERTLEDLAAERSVAP